MQLHIAKAIEEAYRFSCYFGSLYKVYSFFLFFASNFFGSGYFYRPVEISSLFLLLSLPLFPIVPERDEVIK